MKLRILYCDDQKEFVRKFRERHINDFDVECVSKVGDLFEDICRRREAELPDVLLLDLYHPHLSDGEDPDAQTTQQRANEKLHELSEMISEVREYVDRAWSPVAIDVLEELRERYPAHKLPIMVYTQRGLLLLKDEEIKRIEDAGAEWLLKDPEHISPETEASRIRRYVTRERNSQHMPRDSRLAAWSIAASLLGAAAGVAATLIFA